MTEWSSISLEKEFLEKIDQYIEEESVFQNRKEFIKHAVQNQMDRG